MTPTDAARALNVKPNTLRKWTLVGLRLKNGSRLILPCRKIGGRLDVSQEDIDAFNQAMTADRRASAPRKPTDEALRSMNRCEAIRW